MNTNTGRLRDLEGRQNQLLLESVAEGIFGVDTEGRCVFVNPAAETMLGFTAKDLLGQPLADPAGAEIKDRVLFKPAAGGTVAALHIIREDLKLRP